MIVPPPHPAVFAFSFILVCFLLFFNFYFDRWLISLSSRRMIMSVALFLDMASEKADINLPLSMHLFHGSNVANKTCTDEKEKRSLLLPCKVRMNTDRYTLHLSTGNLTFFLHANRAW